MERNGFRIAAFLARSRLRRSGRASVALAVLAGAAAAVPITLWTASERSASAVADFVAWADTPDALVNVCPPGVDPQAEGGVGACTGYDPVEELAAMRAMQGVTGAARTVYAFVDARGEGGRGGPTGLIGMADDAPTATPFGDPIVVAGRLAGADATDELMVSEAGARALGVRPGDVVTVRDMLGAADGGEPSRATVTGVIRTPTELLPPGDGGDTFSPRLFVRHGWSQAHVDEVSMLPTLAVWLGDHDVAAFGEQLDAVLSGRAYHLADAIDASSRSTYEQATGYESRAIAAAAAFAALTGAFFVGQAVSRRARSEHAEAPVLTGLGFCRSELAIATALRWAPVAVGAAVVTTAASAAASLLGPIGLARRAPWERTLAVDGLAVAAGCVAVVGLVVVAALAGRSPSGRARLRAPAPAITGSPSVRVGVAFTRASLARGTALPLISAVLGTALAIAVVIAAAAWSASLRRVLDEPARFGASWDVMVGMADSPEAEAEIADRVASVEGVDAAALLPGTSVSIDGRDTWIMAYVPIDGVDPLQPAMIAGDAPAANDEIALGLVTARRAGARIGDEVVVDSGVSGGASQRFRVVGTAMINDNFEPHVGIGALVSPSGLERVAPESTGNAVVRLREERRDAAVSQLRDAFADEVHEPTVPASLRNAERVAGLPMYLGIMTALFAAVTLTHALTLTIRRQQTPLAVCRVLGFTRAQVRAALLTQGTLLALAAGALGVLAGFIGARQGWIVIARGLGVQPTAAYLPWWLAALGVASPLAVTVAVVGVIGRSAALRRPAAALRTE
ncbi:MAG TPA: FtsX-like permease family protein [Acidimicrobiales bacterium]|nr:FtsX-like permease family protein [Acidimicrobiales bacterium]